MNVSEFLKAGKITADLENRFYRDLIAGFLRKEAGMSPGGGESPAGEKTGGKSSANAAKKPGDSREAGGAR